MDLKSKCIKMADHLKIKIVHFNCNTVFNEHINFNWDEAYITWNIEKDDFELYACNEHPHNGSVIDEIRIKILDNDKNYKKMINSLYEYLNVKFATKCKIELEEKMLHDYINSILK